MFRQRLLIKTADLPTWRWMKCVCTPKRAKKILDNTNHSNKESDVEFIVSQHHERIDGSGYPLGLKGFDIHPYASICCLADVYDALTGKRSYKTAKTPREALEIMTEQMSNHFNREMLNKFIALFERSGILNQMKKNGEL